MSSTLIECEYIVCELNVTESDLIKNEERFGWVKDFDICLIKGFEYLFDR